MEEHERVPAFVEGLLKAGAKSFSHVFRLLEHYEDSLKAAAPDSDSKAIVVRKIFDFWRHSEQV